MQVGLGFWGSKTLLSAVEIGLFTALGRGAGHRGGRPRAPRAAPTREPRFPGRARRARFPEREDGAYRNTPATALLLDRARPSYIGGMLEMANHRLFRFWGGLTDGLRTGRLQNEAASGETPFFEALYADPARPRQFLAAMTGISHGANRRIAEFVPWDGYGTFADIGTAQRDLAVQIAAARPELMGVGFDPPPVGPIFADHVAANGLGERVRFVAGDFFADALPAADVLTMGHILHDRNLDEKRMLIGEAYAALPPGGSLVVYDAMIDDERSRPRRAAAAHRVPGG